MKKYFIIIGLVATITLQAQDKGHYFNANIGGGFNGLKYTLHDGDVKSGTGGTFNLGYSFFVNSNWGFGAGLGLQTAQSKGILNFTSSSSAIDADGDNFELRTYFNNWTEKQKALFLDIPVGIQYQRWFNGKNGMLAMAGGKISVPVSSSYEVVSGSITTTGYYEQWNVELSDMPQHGFTTSSDRPSANLALNTSYSVFADLGWQYKMSEKLDLYAGGYISFGLNNLISAGEKPVYQVSGTYNSMLVSRQTDKVNLLTFGVKVGLRLRANRVRKAAMTSVIAIEEPATGVKEAVVIQTVDQVDIQPQVEEVQEQVSVEDDKSEPEPIVSIKKSITDAQAVADRIKLKFPVNSAVPLNDEFDSVFMELAQILIANQEMKIRIQGHTCNLSSRTYNLKISMDRAEIGKVKLMNMGVPASQIIIESKAFDEPLVPNTNEENRAQNRRIKLIVE